MVSLNESEGSQEWLNQAPFSFDLSVMAIYPCLTSGGTLNLVDKEMINKPKLLNEMLVNTPINAWYLHHHLWKCACYYLTLTNQVTQA